MTLLPAGSYRLDLQPEHAVSFTLVAQSSRSGGPELLLSAKGAGQHTFELRSANLNVAGEARQTVDLVSGRTGSLAWHVRIDKQDTPWVAVIVPDGDLGRKVELTGTWK